MPLQGEPARQQMCEMLLDNFQTYLWLDTGKVGLQSDINCRTFSVQQGLKVEVIPVQFCEKEKIKFAGTDKVCLEILQSHLLPVTMSCYNRGSQWTNESLDD